MPDKKFVFLYPISEYIDNSVKNASLHLDSGGKRLFRENYKRVLNSCIDLRYRDKGFEIFYANFLEHKLSDIVDILPSDRVIDVGLDFKTHTTERKNGTYHYPDENYILNKIDNPERLVVSGFHMWDCVEKLASRAHKNGIGVLVDEDLTEFFPSRINDKDFKPNVYPSFNARSCYFFKEFMEARKGKLWLWQDY